MSTVKVKYKLSQDAIKRIFVETGIRHPESQSIEIELTTLEIEDRKKLVEMDRDGEFFLLGPALNWRDETMVIQEVIPQQDLLRDAADVLRALQSIEESKPVIEAQAAQKAADYNEAIMARIREYMADEKRGVSGEWSARKNGANYAECQAAIDAAYAEKRRREEYWKKFHEQNQAEEKARNESAKTQKRAERLEWARSHNVSSRLIRGLEAGYDCARLYYTERAQAEYPGFEVDFKKSVDWNDRPCPSDAALDVLEGIIKNSAGRADKPEVKIVWITAPPNYEKDEQVDDETEFLEREGVVVDDDNYGYLLVKYTNL